MDKGNTEDTKLNSVLLFQIKQILPYYATLHKYYQRNVELHLEYCVHFCVSLIERNVEKVEMVW